MKPSTITKTISSRVTVILYFFLILYTGKTAAQGAFWGVTSQGGSYGTGVIFTTRKDGTQYTVKKNFTNGGANPNGSLLQSSNGKFYGTTTSGGAYNSGILFEYDHQTNTYLKKIDFTGVANGSNPNGKLIEAANGKIYGMTNLGGQNDMGTIFEYNPSTNSFSTLLHFDGTNTGSFPYGSIFQAANNKIYGLTYFGGAYNFGILFEFDLASNSLTKLVDFDDVTTGSYPAGELIELSQGVLVGMTSNGGAFQQGNIFEYTINSKTISKTADFEGVTNGAYPFGSLTKTTQGKFFGMTRFGGASNDGVLFEYDPINKVITSIIHFEGATTGNNPCGSLLEGIDGNLYGMTYSGGANNLGAFFKYNTHDSTLTNTINFNGNDNGQNPYSNVMQSTNGTLFAMTSGGGRNNKGLIIAIEPSTSHILSSMHFDGTAEGSFPYGGLVLHTNGKLYGSTYSGGVNDLGVFYEFNPTTDSYKKIADMDGIRNGSNPNGSYIEAKNGKLYGMTRSGGHYSKGTIIEFNPETNTITKLFDFDGVQNGSFPIGSLLLNKGEILYGLTSSGGQFNQGVLFEYNINTNTYSKTIDFNSTRTGSTPNGSLINFSANGKFYGVTSTGGYFNQGTIFEYDPTTHICTKLKDFNGADGSYPYGSLMESINGTIYGMSYFGGENNEGVLFSFQPSLNQFTKLMDFSRATTGAYPNGTLNESSNGNIYGMTYTGGREDNGVFFEFNPHTNLYTKKLDFANSNGGNPDNATLVYTKESQSINFQSIPEKKICEKSFILTAQATSELPVTYTSSNVNVARINGNEVLFSGAGETIITAHQPGNKFYFEAKTITQRLIVSKLDQTINFEKLTETVCVGKSIQLTATATSGLTITLTSSDTTIAKIMGNSLAVFKAGEVTITATQSGNETYYKAADVLQKISVVPFEKRQQKIVFETISSKVLGDAAFQLEAQSTSSLRVRYTSSNPRVAYISGSSVVILSSGNTVITAIQDGNDYYFAATPVNQMLEVKKANQVITFSSISNKELTSRDFTLLANSTSGLPVSFVCDSKNIIITGNKVRIIKPGRVTITAYQPGNESFSAASPIQQSFCINPPKPELSLVNSTNDQAVLISNNTNENVWYQNDILLSENSSTTLTINKSGVYKLQAKADDCYSSFTIKEINTILTHGENLEPLSISVFPNPSTDWITISLGDISGEKEIIIAQSNGKLVDSFSVSSNETSLNISNYAVGVYFVKIVIGNSNRILRFTKV